VIFWSIRRHGHWFQNSAPRPASQASVSRSDRVSGSAHDVRIGSKSEEFRVSKSSPLHPTRATSTRARSSAFNNKTFTAMCFYRLEGRYRRATPQFPILKNRPKSGFERFCLRVICEFRPHRFRSFHNIKVLFASYRQSCRAHQQPEQQRDNSQCRDARCPDDHEPAQPASPIWSML
jgi:hypothetical protein